ncbi:MAG: class I SAM-dependent methyltransferase [Gammaproteobacteria bacterium]|nr:class I SAM-dependent methyltransferase [Gammaproteobacteria bacterium]
MTLSSLVNRYVDRIADRLIEPIDKRVNQKFYDFPLGSKPWAVEKDYLDLWDKTKQIAYPQTDGYEKETGFAMDKTWLDELALLTQIVIKPHDLCYQHGRLLYSALSQMVSKRPKSSISILETGTARGFSSLCMAKALSDADRPGRIVTYDVLPHSTKMYWNCIADKEGSQSRAELLKPYQDLIDEYIIFHQGDTQTQLNKIDISRVHFAFLDGGHTYQHVVDEFDYLKNRQQTGDMIFFDDYTPNHFPGVVDAVDEICQQHGYSKQVITISDQRGYVIGEKL